MLLFRAGMLSDVCVSELLCTCTCSNDFTKAIASSSYAPSCRPKARSLPEVRYNDITSLAPLRSLLLVDVSSR